MAFKQLYECEFCGKTKYFFPEQAIGAKCECEETNIDLNNTWCEATEENYEALYHLGLENGISLNIKTDKYLYIINSNIESTSLNLDVVINIKKKIFKQIHLVNGKFEFVKNELETLREKYESGDYIFIYFDKLENKYIVCNDDSHNFNYCLNKYKLIPINKKHADILDAFLKDNNIEIVEIDTFCNEHREYKVDNFVDEYKYDAIYEIKEKPKQWYEIESNFPVLMFKTVRAYHKSQYKLLKQQGYKLATKEEILSLLVK